jgi:hypothetical protein
MEVVQMSDKRVKSVAFNLDLEDEKRLFKFISRRNFSGYVKQLITKDLEKRIKQKRSQNSGIGQSFPNNQSGSTYNKG